MKLRVIGLLLLLICVFGGLVCWLSSPTGIWTTRKVPSSEANFAKLTNNVELPTLPSVRIEANQTLLSKTTSDKSTLGSVGGGLLVNSSINIAEAVLGMAKNFAGRGWRGRSSNQAADPATLVVDPPLAVYNLSLAEIAYGSGLDTIQPSASLYPVESATHVVFGGQVSEAASGKGQVISVLVLNYGPGPLSKIGPALDYIASLDQIKSGRYERRILQGDGYMAVWLKSQAGGVDLIYAVQGPSEVEKNNLCTASDFMKLMTVVAKQNLLKPKINYGGAPPRYSNGSANAQ